MNAVERVREISNALYSVQRIRGFGHVQEVDAERNGRLLVSAASGVARTGDCPGSVDRGMGGSRMNPMQPKRPYRFGTGPPVRSRNEVGSGDHPGVHPATPRRMWNGTIFRPFGR